MIEFNLFDNKWFSYLFNVSEDYMKWIGIRKFQNKYFCEWYQENCRIYLDEYEVEEVDLRVNFDTSLLMKRFMVKE